MGIPPEIKVNKIRMLNSKKKKITNDKENTQNCFER